MQKKVIATLVSSAFAGVAGVAQAGPISVASVTTYATEAITSSATITLPGIAYSLTAPLAVGSTQTVRLTLDSGSVATCPSLAFTGTGGAALTFTATGVSGGASAPGQCSWSVTVATAPVPSNAILSFTGGTLSAPTALAVAGGGAINATAAILTQGGTLVESSSGVVANSAAAWAIAAVSSSTLTTPETARVNVAATPALTAFLDAQTGDVTGQAANGPVNLGRVRVTNTAGIQVEVGGSTAVSFANSATQALTLTVTGSFGSGSSVYVSTSASCGASPGLGALTQNAGRTSASTTVSIANAVITDPAEGGSKDVFVCYTVAGGSNTIPTTQFAVSGSLTAISAAPSTTTSALASTNIYNLTLNGSQVDIRNYVPNNTSGWISAYRIINTGAVSAAVTGQFIGVDGALVGTGNVIVGNLVSGGVAVVSAAQIEAAIGAISATGGVGPRLRITAPTDSLRVQAFACQPNGNCFLNSDAQGIDGGAAAALLGTR